MSSKGRFAVKKGADEEKLKKQGTGPVNLRDNFQHDEIHDPAYQRAPQPVTDFAIFAVTGSDVILNRDSTGRITYHNDGFQTTLTLQLSKNMPLPSGTANVLVSSMTLTASTFRSLEFEEITMDEIKEIKNSNTYPPDEVARAYKAKLEFSDGFVNSHLNTGCHDFAREFASAVTRDHSLTIFIIGHASTSDNLNQVVAQFLAENETPAWKLWHKEARRMVFQEGQMLPPADRPVIKDYVKPTSFAEVQSYATQLGFAVIQAHEESGAEKAEYEQHLKRIRVVRIVGRDNEFHGFLPVPADDECRLEDGDKLKINFDIDNGDPQKEWSGSVTPSLPGTPASLKTIIFNRPWDKETSDWKDELPENIMDAAALRGDDGFANILSNTGMLCKVKLVSSGDETKNVFAALDSIAQNKEEEWNGNIQKSLLQLHLASELHKLETYSIFRHLIEDDPQYLDKLILNESQRQAHSNAQAALGAISLIQGGPGTGKTHFALETIKAYVSSEKHLPVVHYSPDNGQVDEFAQKAHNMVLQLQESGKAAGKFVLRVHSKSTEQSAWYQTALLKGDRPPNSRPLPASELSSDDQALLRDVDLARQIAEQYKVHSTPNHPLIHDDRYVLHELSVGHRMLQFAGVIPDGPKADDQSKYNDFRTMYARYGSYCETKDPESWSKEDSESLGHLAQRLRSDVLRAAAVLCSTAANGGEYTMRNNTKGVKLIIFDEAARTPEHITLPILINNYFDLGGVVFVGDPSQLKPLSLSRKQNNVFRDFLESTLMARLVMIGFNMEFFDTQHRMHPRILEIVNRIIYKNKLVTADALKVENLPADHLSKQLETYNQEKFNRNVNVVYLDFG